MKGYEVVTSDDHKVGHVVDVQGDNLIVEHGTVFKSKHALPLTFAHTDDAERVVRVSVSKETVEASPKLDNGAVDERAVAEHYGLAGGFDRPATQGEGDVLPDDPARTADEDAIRAGVEPADAERARVREGIRAEGDVPDSSPGLLGDRLER
jgi:hypothetical protein